MEVLQDSRGQTRLIKGLGDLFGDSRGLWRGFDDDGVAGKKSWDQGIDQNEIGILFHVSCRYSEGLS